MADEKGGPRERTLAHMQGLLAAAGASGALRCASSRGRPGTASGSDTADEIVGTERPWCGLAVGKLDPRGDALDAGLERGRRDHQVPDRSVAVVSELHPDLAGSAAQPIEAAHQLGAQWTEGLDD